MDNSLSRIEMKKDRYWRWRDGSRKSVCMILEALVVVVIVMDVSFFNQNELGII